MRRKFCNHANNLSIFHLRLYRRNDRSSCVFGFFLLQLDLCGAINSTPYSIASFSSSGSLSYALSPIRRSGFSLLETKHLERVVSARVTSCGEADVMCMAIGRLELSDIAMSFVPLPRLVFPTSSPLF
jgi:hypothetical protein